MNTFLKRIPILGLALLVVVGCTADANVDRNTNNNDDEPREREFSTQYENVRLVQVAGPFENPWAVAFLPDERKLITERPGRLNIVENGEITEVTGLPDVTAQGQGGLMDVVLHPEYEDNGWIYLTYSKANEQNQTATTLIRGRLDGTQLVDVEEIFMQDRYSAPGRHYGSRLAWMNDGTLLLSIGDRGAEPPRAQDLGDHAGTVLRLNDDGSVPDDNPFVGQNDALDEIYSYGHRNIQGMIVDPETGEIWATEHGPRGGDELNRVEAGENYGWPTVTLGLDYRTEDDFPDAEDRHGEGMVDPVHEFLPTLAPSGLALVTADQFPAWHGNLLAGGLRSERIIRLVLDGETVLHGEELLLGEVGRIRDVREGPDGSIYVVADESEGAIYRIEPAE